MLQDYSRDVVAAGGLAFDPVERPPAPDALVDVVARVLALVLDRLHARGRAHASDE
jgi:hypothetical protein